MLKLTKYEFRKNIFVIAIFLGILAILQCGFTIYCLLGKESEAVLFAMFLTIAAMIAFFMVIGLGIQSYSKELSSKTSYLIFMTPNSSLQIILSKLLYTFLLGIIIAVLLIVLAMLDFHMLMKMTGDTFSFFELIKAFLELTGIDYMSAVYSLIMSIITFLASFFMLITLAYLSITLTATLLQNRKGKGLISSVLYLCILFLVSKIADLLPVIYANPGTAMQAVTSTLPVTGFYLVIIICCVFGCSALLDKYVSL